jgi:hypothetical protein
MRNALSHVTTHHPFSLSPWAAGRRDWRKKQNDEQTVHHPQTLKKENKNPSLRIREKNLVRLFSMFIRISSIHVLCFKNQQETSVT